MNFAYAAADVIISSAEAIAISELCLIGKPLILVPSPNVSEDHQTKKAMALVHENAAILVTDANSEKMLIPEVLKLVNDKEKCEELSREIVKLGKPDATAEIVDELDNLIRK